MYARLNLAHVEQSQSRLGPYLGGLLRAIKQPTDPELFEQAKMHEVRVKQCLPGYLAVGWQLGPEPSHFASTEEWAATRQQAVSASKEIGELWLSAISDDDGSWLTLFVHPDGWPELRPVIAEASFEQLMRKSHSVAKCLSPFSAVPVQLRHFRTGVSVDVMRVCDCVVEIVQKHGSLFVRNDRGIVDFVAGSEFRAVTSLEAHNLLRKTNDLKLPSCWAGLITRVCSTAEGVSVSQLLDFWRRHHSMDMLWICNVQKPQEALIEQALDIGTRDAVYFAAFLASNRGLHRDISIPLHLSERVVRGLCDSIVSASGAERPMSVELLLQQAPGAHELATWANPEIVNLIRGQHWQLERLADRIREMVNSRSGFDQEQLRRALGRFVEKRSEFPVEIPLAALDALLRADEIAATPLSDSDWQKVADN